jgi:hypothetical protein
MCGRYLGPDAASIERGWHTGGHEAFARRFDVPRTTRVRMLTSDAGELALATARRGLIPY